MTSAEIKAWVGRAVHKEAIRKIVEQFSAKRVVSAMATIGNECPERIRAFLLNRGDCPEA